jgi:hypothetical protein
LLSRNTGIKTCEATSPRPDYRLDDRIFYLELYCIVRANWADETVPDLTKHRGIVATDTAAADRI